jgi:hypothetical protein
MISERRMTTTSVDDPGPFAQDTWFDTHTVARPGAAIV